MIDLAHAADAHHEAKRARAASLALLLADPRYRPTNPNRKADR